MPMAMFVSFYILSNGVIPRILMPLARTEHAPVKSCNLAWGTEDKKLLWMSSLLRCCSNPLYHSLKWCPSEKYNQLICTYMYILHTHMHMHTHTVTETKFGLCHKIPRTIWKKKFNPQQVLAWMEVKQLCLLKTTQIWYLCKRRWASFHW